MGNVKTFTAPAALPFRSVQVAFSPVQAGSGDPSPSNVRAISGWDSINVTRSGKNLYNQTAYPLTQGYWVHWEDLSETRVNASYAAAGIGTRIPCQHLQGATITLNKAPGGSNPGFNFADASGQYITGTKAQYGNSGRTAGTPWAITLPNDASTMAFTTVPDDTQIQLELGSTATTYEPYTATTLTATLPQTCYGGYVDLVTGELVVTHGLITLDGTESWSGGSVINDRRRFNTPSSNRYNMCYGDSMPQGVVMCDLLRPAGNGKNADASELPPLITAGTYNPQFYCGIPLDWGITTVAEWQAWLTSNPVHVVVRHETPITYQLTPQQLSTLAGVNNLWSNAGDVNVAYYSGESAMEARRRIMLNTPHLATATGDIVSFSTDMAAPIKGLKATFAPVQAGSGDPSPTNIRPITGWQGLTVWHTGKNLFDKSGGNILNAYITTDAIATLAVGKTVFIPCKPNTKYTVSKNPGQRFTIAYTTELPANGVEVYGRVSDGTASSLTITTGADAKFLAAFVYNSNYDSITADTMLSSVQIELGSTATAYTPYTGQTYTVTFPAVGKNLLKNNAASTTTSGVTFTVNADGTIDVSGENTGSSYVSLDITNAFLAESGKTYILSGAVSSNIRLRDVTGSVTDTGSGATITGDGVLHTIQLRVLAGTSITGTVTVKPMIRLSTVSDATYEPYGTAYGGTLDLVTGVLTVTHWYCEKAVIDMDNTDTYPGWKNTVPRSVVGTINKFIYAYTNVSPYGNQYVGANTNSNDPGSLLLSKEKFNLTQTEWKANYPDMVIQFAIPYAEPVTYQLTPQQIATLRGVNTVWSDAETVECRYWKH